MREPSELSGAGLVVALTEVGESDRARVGTKAAVLGELLATGHLVPDGFVVTVDAFRRWRRSGGIALPGEVDLAVRRAYAALGEPDVSVAVRSSAIAEDLPSTSFAGVYDSYLDTVGAEAVVERVLDCWSSLGSPRVVAYRSALERDVDPDADACPDADHPAMAVLVQVMAPADRAGVAMSEDLRRPGSGHTVIEAARGRGTAVVGGAVLPDRYVVDGEGRSVVSKEQADMSAASVLCDDEVVRISAVVRGIAGERGAPQDVEFAIGADGRIWVLQARPITHAVRATRRRSHLPASSGEVVLTGVGASPGTATGAVRILGSSSEAVDLLDGEVLVASTTDPGWIVAMRVAGAIVTDVGGLTSHAAIVSRELGLPCVVGAGTATTDLVDGEIVTVDGSSGTVSRSWGSRVS